MPLYEYTCQDCKEKFELLIRSGERDKETICPYCGSIRTQRAISLFAYCSNTSTPRQDAMPSCAYAEGG